LNRSSAYSQAIGQTLLGHVEFVHAVILKLAGGHGILERLGQLEPAHMASDIPCFGKQDYWENKGIQEGGKKKRPFPR
jgi:hypothetical protein